MKENKVMIIIALIGIAALAVLYYFLKKNKKEKPLDEVPETGMYVEKAGKLVVTGSSRQSIDMALAGLDPDNVIHRRIIKNLKEYQDLGYTTVSMSYQNPQ